MDDNLIFAQRILEQQTVERGIERYTAKVTAKVEREGFDKHDEVQKLIRGATPILAEGVTEWLAKASLAKGRKSTGYSAIASIDPVNVAAIGTTAIFQNLGDGGKTVAITKSIGRRIEIEIEGAALEAKSPKEALRFLKMAEGKQTTETLKGRFKALVEEHEAALHWTDQTRVLVGQTVLNIALTKLADLFASKTVKDKGKTHAVIELTDEAAEALIHMEDTAALQHLPLRPMVHPPRPWTHMGSGAYIDYRLSRLAPMVRVRSKEQRALIKEAIDNGSMDEVLTALNAIQDTRWAIDVRVLAMVLWARDAGVRPSSSFPSVDMPKTPAKIDPKEWEAMTQEARSAISRQRRSLKLMRKAMGVDNKTFMDDTAEAVNLSTFEAFYLPHSLDFRGRTYAIPYFNHQRSDHLKALFRFADGIPLGDTGGKWLMIHLANTGDFGKVSKKPFDDRIAWVKEHEQSILAVAKDPVVNNMWLQADSPFCFLQACYEYAEWAETGYSPDFISSIPGAADGSCSGLQHYACITRSEEEAYHVNLLPREDVGDIYQVTADRAVPTLETAASGGDEAARVILENGFGRSEVKRNVMTYFYGSARFGMRDQHMQDLMRPLADSVALGKIDSHPYALMTERTDKETGEVTMRLDGGYTCASVLAAHTYAAVTSVAAKADEASSWIQQVTSILAHESRSLIWTTPTGFPVVQRYNQYDCKEVNLWLYDRSIRIPSGTDKVDTEGNVLSRVRLLIRQAPTSKVDKKAMRNASSPNVIHSMDAAHLHRSVAMAKEAGIDHFSMIHDSFGTHMGNMEKFNGMIREALVSCYTEYCPLETIDAYARTVLSAEGIDKLPPIPAKGSFDLEQILKAQYAFA